MANFYRLEAQGKKLYLHTQERASHLAEAAYWGLEPGQEIKVTHVSIDIPTKRSDFLDFLNNGERLKITEGAMMICRTRMISRSGNVSPIYHDALRELAAFGFVLDPEAFLTKQKGN